MRELSHPNTHGETTTFVYNLTHLTTSLGLTAMDKETNTGDRVKNVSNGLSQQIHTPGEITGYVTLDTLEDLVNIMFCYGSI